MFSEQFEHFFGFFGVDLEEENLNIFESLLQSLAISPIFEFSGMAQTAETGRPNK